MLGLDKCLKLRRKLNDVDEKILELRGVSYAPKIKVLSFVPTQGGSIVNKLDMYLIRLEELQRKRKYLETEINKQWQYTEDKLREIGATVEQVKLIKCRFYHGLPWKICSYEMQVSYPEKAWNEAKAYRVYREILNKCTR